MQVWLISKLPTAKETLSKFSILNGLLSGFECYEQKLYKNTKNSIMFLCLPNFDGSYGNQIQHLEILERTLKILKVNTWSLAKYRKLKSRIANEKFDVSYSAQTELEAAAEMLSIVGEDNLTLYPELEHGGDSDLRLVLDGRPIYIEVGNPSPSIPETKIDKILSYCAKHLGKQVSHSHNPLLFSS